MSTLVELVVSLLALMALGAAGTLWFVLHKAHRRLRVHARVRSDAPLRWLVPLSPAALLHRRLRSLARVAAERTSSARRHAPDATALLEIGDQLLWEATRIDASLCALVGVTGRPRRAALVGVERSIDRYERSVARYAATVDDWTSGRRLPQADSIDAIEDRLDAVTAATRTVSELQPHDLPTG